MPDRCPKCGRAKGTSAAAAEKMRATIVRLRSELRTARGIRKRDDTRAQARVEAAETGEPAQAVYERWGVS